MHFRRCTARGLSDRAPDAAPVAEYSRHDQQNHGFCGGVLDIGTAGQIRSRSRDCVANCWPRHKIVNKVRCLRGVWGCLPTGVPLGWWRCAADRIAAGRSRRLFLSSELPGREREAIRATARAAVAAGRRRSFRCRAPSRREGAEKLMVVDPRRAHHRRDRLQRRGSRSRCTRDIVGARSPGHRDLRHRSAHHREIRRRRLCALARDRAAAGAEPARRDRAHPDHRRLYRPGRVAGRSLSKYRDFFSYYAAKITAERPINVKTLERYLLLAGDLPGPEVQEQPEGLGDQTGRRDAGGRGGGEAGRLFRPRRQSRHQGTRPDSSISTASDLNNLGRMHESWTISYAGTFQFTELQYWMLSYRQVLTSEGLTLFVNDSSAAASRAPRSCSSWNTRRAATCSKAASAIRSSAAARSN